MKEAKVMQFRTAHKKDKPLVLLNIWDVTTATELIQKKIKLIPTGSFAMADFYSYQDGEKMPFEEILGFIEQVNGENHYITVDIEAGYASNLTDLALNVEGVVNNGAVGINIEDKRPNLDTLYSIEEQCERLVCIKQKLNAMKKDLFINVRTDLYFTGDIVQNNQNERLLNQTITRIKAYEKTGIDGIFIPGLKNKKHIKKIAAETTLPINIMLDIKEDSIADYLNSGVSRISFGPSIYFLYNEQENQELAAFYTSLLTDLAELEEKERIELFRLK
ncbi:hypothetical protein A5821_002362 [Enterococcus sp. 7F3_DIV0205]|uniref:Isocitrate lyase/phosphoenolpyruvate mutase family protein n=1 Tax=Candidatus Enterococcus palustris TaxID=1834189 RepID=A0AAQ3Y7X2_9ENTE|nr:isocitrate lyase/phosphoenolpyruvate mutase family protein [Enterococcus sp. 7F3_DIV0205]OTN82792.1 hypothetical protein A5821_002715 [Enterococcus sp. 7F3_DIV0205]